MKRIIDSTLVTLNKSKNLLNLLSNEELSNASVGPYYSSIGSHIRHVLDFFACAFELNSEGKVDLTSRKRNAAVETCSDTATEYYQSIIDKLVSFDVSKTDSIVVIDDIGDGKIEMNYTFSALLSQATTHAIHHYAMIGFILDHLNITIEDANFGYNPTTPKKKVVNAV